MKPMNIMQSVQAKMMDGNLHPAGKTSPTPPIRNKTAGQVANVMPANFAMSVNSKADTDRLFPQSKLIRDSADGNSY